VHEERQDVGKRWRSDMVKAAASLHRLVRGTNLRPVVKQGRVMASVKDVEQALGHQRRTRRICSQLALEER
jgi:hypothetical protein